VHAWSATPTKDLIWHGPVRERRHSGPGTDRHGRDPRDEPDRHRAARRPARHTGLARSGYYRWFTDRAERLYFAEEDRPRHTRTRAARLRAALTAGTDVARAARIVAELKGVRPEFVRAWERQEVAQRWGEAKTILHPDLGRIDVDAQVLFTENRAQTLVVLVARPGADSQGKLELLSVGGHQQLTP
jgi:hypothetical protein